MGKFSYHSNNTRNFYSRSEYPGVSKRRWNERQRYQRENQRLWEEIEQEMYEEAVAAAENGPSPAQRLRRNELLAKKADYLKKFTASNAMRKALIDDIVRLDMEKLRMESEYGQILAELDTIPAELSSSRMGLSEAGKYIMEEVGGNVVKKEGGNAVKEERGNVVKEERGNVVKDERGNVVKNGGGNVVKEERGLVVKNENEAAMKQKGANVPKEGGERGSSY